MSLLSNFGLNYLLFNVTAVVCCCLQALLESLNCSFYCIEASREIESSKKWRRKIVQKIKMKNKELDKKKEIELKRENE